ncbi:serine hydrolase [Paenibacillus ihbetae]|uniref:Serine hydrolase n=1 Tax=Paenibacillus ihbetae TaxID=1870820 RepID=A0A1B2E3M6_9BACL|nr:serine hydrolase domain-containing protein [Paenibacillus ihbetae]ANY74559.1 serine hydrolase [Paenibacillus ihbetae]
MKDKAGPSPLDQMLMDRWMAAMARKRNIFGAVICAENQDRSLSIISSGGEMEPETPYFIASVTKLYVTAVLLQLRSRQRLRLDDRIGEYLPEKLIKGIHVYRSIDYSREITIKQLMSNTSGLPDYFSGRVFADLIAGKDQSWPLEKTLEAVRQLRPKFPPGMKAQYSDTNYQLLGKLIETITGQPIEAAFKEYIFDRLNLTQTYVYKDPLDGRPASFYYRQTRLHIPLYMSSIAPEGGIVSTARETMTFLRAFFHGDLFPQTDLKDLMEWRFLWTPGTFFYGSGIVRQPLSLLNMKDGLIGHWGQSGAFAFHHPDTGLYFTGTVNQAIGQSAAVYKIARIIRHYKKTGSPA